MTAYLDAHNMPGAISESRFDNWYAGFTDWAHVFRNEISFFTETALYAMPRRTFTPCATSPRTTRICAR